jgi:hypothetical protein
MTRRGLQPFGERRPRVLTKEQCDGNSNDRSGDRQNRGAESYSRKNGTGSRRRRGARAAEPSTARFFLIKTSGNGTVELGQEVASENEAMVESFRVGGSFAVVTEWKAQVDLATGVPVIKKEAVKSEKKVAHS